MPRRHQVRIACQRCRRKRARCDGDEPCERCREAEAECVFEESRRVSKGDLRAEINRLRRSTEQSDALLDALSSMDDANTYRMVAQGLLDAAVTRPAIYRGLPVKHDVDSGVASSLRRHSLPVVSAPLSASVSASSTSASGPEGLTVICPYCRSLFPMLISPPGSSGAGSSAGSSNRSRSDPGRPEAGVAMTPVFIPDRVAPMPSVARAAATAEGSKPRQATQRIDCWTRTGWTAAAVLDHLDSLLKWDYLPFCLLCKDPFLRDLTNGTGQYCSSALVNALLALSQRTFDEPLQRPHHRSLPLFQDANIRTTSLSSTAFQEWAGGQAFFDEAVALTNCAGHSPSLPDIQALGILALYQIGSGCDVEARELADAFAAAAADLCSRVPLTAGTQDEYAHVRATTYCGAISLVRILKLAMARPSGLCVTLLQDDGITLGQPRFTFGPDRNKPLLEEAGVRMGQVTTLSMVTAVDAHESHLSGLQLIPAKIFQLTEWVYQLLASPGHVSSDQVVSIYRHCLHWYESFFALFSSDDDNSPFTLFIHIYYQFCLLSLLRPFINANLDAFNIYPREICLQAAKSILALTQSNVSVYGLRRISSLLPHFVLASGLLNLAVEEAGRGIPVAEAVTSFDSHVIRSEAIPAALMVNSGPFGGFTNVDGIHSIGSHEQGQQQLGPSHQDQLSPSHTSLPAVAHARLLLTEMSAVHPAAAAVESHITIVITERAATSGFDDAAAYDLHRPSYPAQAVESLLGHLGVAGRGGGARVVDLAAGTGKFTELLAARPEGLEVVAVEPVDAMRRTLEAKALPGVIVREGLATAMDVDAAWADAVVAAQSFHWFAHEEALHEIRRVLKPGGKLGVIWNIEEYNQPRAWETSTEWERQLNELILGLPADGPPRFRDDKWRDVFERQARADQPVVSTPLAEERLPFTVWRTRELLWDRVNTLSQVYMLKEGGEREAFRARFDEILDGAGGDKWNDKGEIEFHGTTVYAWTARL
ncbi:2-deoxy-D-gluconate 3-dehydrogenase [Purpureocillium lavendulum]|uniref:2-deoxy-D-gluconate 3-dehydrogenase n=1 Tax=Purpureocillium lavendulum TaxID=1247861 RepID=A0AB34G391_9HYPO|nr:2-deoxy-D-gluconate 3-dehydrogenase [Purpureocillium lavendulum]